MIALFGRKYRWIDLLPYRHSIDLSITTEDSGLLNVNIGEELKFECTKKELRLLFAMIARFLGKKESKKLINVKMSNSEKWS